MKTWLTRSGYKIVQVLSGRSNVFLLTNEQAFILIDSGPGFMWKTLRRRLQSLHVEKIDLLFLTHSHFDHASNAHKIKENYSARVIIHRDEAEYLASGENIIPIGTNSLTKFLTGLFAGRFMALAKYQPCRSDYDFDNVFDLAEFGFNAYLVHTPGHTCGSASLVIDDEIALVGDTMFGVFHGTAFPPFASDPGQLLMSWKRLLETKCRLFLPSHGTGNERSLVEKDLERRMTEYAIFTNNENQG